MHIQAGVRFQGVTGGLRKAGEEYDRRRDPLRKTLDDLSRVSKEIADITEYTQYHRYMKSDPPEAPAHLVQREKALKNEILKSINQASQQRAREILDLLDATPHVVIRDDEPIGKALKAKLEGEQGY